jgi:hypothetical protein
MTCGIYLLNFTGTHKVYIGQSKNLEHRINNQHIKNLENNKASPKLQEAFNTYGYPTYTIIAECLQAELDDLEEAAIGVWDSVNNGFNTYSTVNQAPTWSGFGSGSSKYSKQQIIEVFNLLVTTDKPLKEIAELTQVPVHTITTIASLRSHSWLKEEFPERYLVLVSKTKTRRIVSANSIVSDKLSAKSQGIVYPRIQCPQGNVYVIDNAYKFAKQNNLAPNHFQEVLNGHRKSHKGWRVCHEEVQ